MKTVSIVISAYNEEGNIQKLYQEFLEHPNSHKAHEILHTVYTDRFKDSYKDIK